ncbi:MAG: hypothetical protein Q9166_003927 [cf. Caloplaca sp. 2 TL-2023]
MLGASGLIKRSAAIKTLFTEVLAIDACDYQHFCISCSNEASITASFNLYGQYINDEKQRARDPYEVSTLERSPGTLTKRVKLQGPTDSKKESDVKAIYNVPNRSLPALIAHERVSKVWRLEAGLIKSTPKRLLSSKVFEDIANSTNCRIVARTKAGVITVKGDNDQDLEEAMKKLDSLTQALSLRQASPQIHNFVNLENEIDVLFNLIPLAEHEASDHRSTTFITSNLPQLSRPPHLAVLLMARKSGAIITQPRSCVDHEGAILSHYKHTWLYDSIPPYGDQEINFEALESRKSETQRKTTSNESSLPLPEGQLRIASSELAPKTVEEWVATTPHTGVDPFEPLDSIREADTKVKPEWVDTLEASEQEDIDAPQPKKRFGKSRKKPGLQDVDDMEYDKHVKVMDADVEHAANLSLQSTLKAPLSSADGRSLSGLIPYLKNHMPNPSAPTLSSLKTLSHSDGQRSPPSETPSIPSTQNSTLPQDLLTGVEQALVYPVMTPITAMNGADISSQSPKASIAPQSQPHSLPPAWLWRNVTAGAENKKSALLIGCVEVERPVCPPATYLEAAKRGAGATRRARGSPRTRGNTRGRIYQGLALSNQPQSLSTSGRHDYQTTTQTAPKTAPKTPRQATGRTLHQDTTKRQVDTANELKAVSSAVVQLLQLGERQGGVMELEVDIGRILFRNDSFTNRRVILSNVWSSVFEPRGAKKMETLFTNRLPNPHTDLGFPANLIQPNGQRIFADDPHESTVKYDFLCETNMGDEEVFLRVSDSASIQVLSTERLVGAIQWHFPKRQWDARLAVKNFERLHDHEDAVNAVVSSLSVVPNSNHTTAGLFADLGNSGLVFKSASILRQVRFRCLTDQDITMCCTEIQKLGPAKEPHRFYSRPVDRETAETNGDLWWEVKLESISAIQQLQHINDMPFGRLADWKAADIIEGGVAERMYNVAADIVTRIDGIGAGIQKSATEVSSATFTESWKPPRVSASYATFW